MDSHSEIIRKIIKEEIMSENLIPRLLEWYNSWNDKLTTSIDQKDYAKIMDIHYKNGLYLLSSLKNVSKKNPEFTEILKDKIEMVRTKMLVIDKVKKMIESLK